MVCGERGRSSVESVVPWGLASRTSVSVIPPVVPLPAGGAPVPDHPHSYSFAAAKALRRHCSTVRAIGYRAKQIKGPYRLPRSLPLAGSRVVAQGSAGTGSEQLPRGHMAKRAAEGLLGGPEPKLIRIPHEVGDLGALSNDAKRPAGRHCRGTRLQSQPLSSGRAPTLSRNTSTAGRCRDD